MEKKIEKSNLTYHNGLIIDEDTDIEDDINPEINIDKKDSIINNYNSPLIRDLDFQKFFSNNQMDNIYIFPYDEKLYLIIQRKWNEIERKGILEWNEITIFGEKIVHNEKMIEEIEIYQKIYQIIERYFQNNFKLYKIPFYFIPIVKETYIFNKYGDMKGNWNIKIHNKINIRYNKLNFPITTPKFKLRDYQDIACIEWHKNEDFGTISLATAGGKTIIALQLIYDIKETTLIVVPTHTLIKQWKDDIIKFLNIDEKEIGVFYGLKKEYKPITIGTYNSLEKYILLSQEEIDEINKIEITNEQKIIKIQERKKIQDFIQNYFSFIILDESHHIPAPTFRRISLNAKALKRLSLSATVERYDGNETLLYFSAGKKVFELTYLQLCMKGYVVPFIYKYLSNYLSPTEIETYQNLGMKLEKKKRMTFFNNTKLLQILNIVKDHILLNHGILIFNSYVDSCYTIYNTLKENLYKVGLILSVKNQKKSNLNRDQTIKEFKEKKIEILISTTVLDEGFNVPDCCCCIIINGTRQIRQMIQRIGRIVRISSSTKIGYVYELTTEGNEECITLDELNHLYRNGMIEETQEYKKSKEILPSNKWIFDYNLINNYAIDKIRKLKIKIPNWVEQELL